MQIQLYTIPVFDNGAALDEMNRFLSRHRVLEVQQELVSTDRGVYWCFSISYLAGHIAPDSRRKKAKPDYKEVLDEKIFEVFTVLRACRKEIAEAEAIPAYAIFTNAELAQIAALPSLSPEKLPSIKGIGSKKAKKYGNRLLEMYHLQINNEKSRKSDS